MNHTPGTIRDLSEQAILANLVTIPKRKMVWPRILIIPAACLFWWTWEWNARLDDQLSADRHVYQNAFDRHDTGVMYTPSTRPAAALPISFRVGLVAEKHVWITTYGAKKRRKNGYNGLPTATGEIYSDKGWTCAVPPEYRTWIGHRGKKDGRTITLSYHGRSVRLRCNDVCPAGTWDVTRVAMVKLLGRYEDTKIKGVLRG